MESRLSDVVITSARKTVMLSARLRLARDWQGLGQRQDSLQVSQHSCYCMVLRARVRARSPEFGEQREHFLERESVELECRRQLG